MLKDRTKQSQTAFAADAWLTVFVQIGLHFPKASEAKVYLKKPLPHYYITLKHCYIKLILINASRFPHKYEVPIIINVSWAANDIRINSEGSCDTEDWSNDAESSALITDTF